MERNKNKIDDKTKIDFFDFEKVYTSSLGKEVDKVLTATSPQSINLNIGIFGGSFNPFHFGHKNIIADFIGGKDLDLLVVVPNYVSPFKTYPIHSSNNKSYSSRELRAEEKLKSIQNHLYNLDRNLQTKIYISDFEIKQKEISYSIDTLVYLRILILSKVKSFECNNLKVNLKFYLLIGDDNLLHFNKWKDWNKILELCEVVIALRNLTKEEINKIIEDNYLQVKDRFSTLSNQYYFISSTQIREKTI